jgi:pimeloyl-ACP methyl ester carboxylesterase
MPYVEVERGVSVFAQDVGGGRPVVLIAGFGLSHEVWDREVRELGVSHRMVCIDLRGTGRSDRPIGDYSVARLAADVEAVLSELDLRDATLVGWSFGGQIAFHVAANAAERLAQLVLVGSNGVRGPTCSETFPFGTPGESLYEALVRGERENRIAARRKTIATGFHTQPDPTVLDFLVSVQLQMPSWAALACYESYLRTDLVAAIPAVTMPVLQILGAEDVVASHDGARWLQTQLADGRIVTLDGCGHYPMFEAAAAFDTALTGFIAEV